MATDEGMMDGDEYGDWVRRYGSKEEIDELDEDFEDKPAPGSTVGTGQNEK